MLLTLGQSAQATALFGIPSVTVSAACVEALVVSLFSSRVVPGAKKAVEKQQRV